MPACSQCGYLEPDGQTCRVAHSKPLRNCLVPIIEGYHKLLFKGCKVLEIGCGAWSPTRDYCATRQMLWEGIDVLEFYLGKKTVATQIASVAEIPFSDGEFDFVISNQSIEHWEENYVPIERGLSEIFRVLKVGGLALLNAPIHYHGDFLFVNGNLDSIRRIFEPFATNIKLEAWRKPSFPLQEIYHLRSSYWFKSDIRNRPAYILDIHAEKKANAFLIKVKRISLQAKLWKGLINKGLLYYLTVVLRRLWK